MICELRKWKNWIYLPLPLFVVPSFPRTLHWSIPIRSHVNSRKSQSVLNVYKTFEIYGDSDGKKYKLAIYGVLEAENIWHKHLTSKNHQNRKKLKLQEL